MNRAQRGFTLVELVISITLTAILVAVVFSAWQRTRLNEERFEKVKQVEKEIYVLYHSFNGLFKNTSSVKVFYNLNRRSFFVGKAESVVFITREPLVAPRRTLHFVDIREENGNLVYQERRLQGLPEDQRPGADMFSSSSPEKMVLLKGIDDFSLRYQFRDEAGAKLQWSNQLLSQENEEFPETVGMSFSYKGQEFRFTFSVVIRDQYDKIPPQFLQ